MVRSFVRGSSKASRGASFFGLVACGVWLAIACGGRNLGSEAGAGAGGGAFAGTGAAGAASAAAPTAGASSIPDASIDEPTVTPVLVLPPAIAPCDPYGFKYDGAQDAQLHPEQCPMTNCTCDGVNTSFPPIANAFGCLVSMDCQAVCTASLQEWYACTELWCQRATDCQSENTVCLRSQSAASGYCAVRGSYCLATLDCLPAEHCVATQENGIRACSNGTQHSPCNVDADCTNGHCALPDGSFIGVCSNGEATDPCFVDNDCKSNRCRLKTCSTGEPGTSCESAADCDGYCAHAECGAGKNGNTCETDAQCASHICFGDSSCSSGADGEECLDDGDCTSTHCASSEYPFNSACTPGTPGSLCRIDSNCISKRCNFMPVDQNGHGKCL